MKKQSGFERLKKKKKKVGISITVDEENLNYLKEDMKKEGAEGITLSSVFDMLLEDFVEFIKGENEKRDKKGK